MCRNTYNDAPEWAEGLEEPRLKIKLKNYRLRKNNNKYFTGRYDEQRKFLDILDSNWRNGGAYLIAGYRGVGKTEFVRRSLDKYESKINRISIKKIFQRSLSVKKAKSANKTLRVHISLGNEKRLDSLLVLNDIVSLMLEELKESHKVRLLAGRWLRYVPLTILSLIALSCLQLATQFNPLSAIQLLFTDYPYLPSDTTRLIFISLLYIVPILVTVWLTGIATDIFGLHSSQNIYIRLSRLLTNMTHDAETSSGASFKGISVISKLRRKSYNSNEIELELKNILRFSVKHGWHVIYIFDELDKLTNRTGDLFDTPEPANPNEAKSRKRQVDNLLGDLKSLISTTKATYIFISGRDMYDAYLSEVGSPNSLYESLFRDHIYIPSLLTDHSDGNTYLLDSMIEDVVVSQILSPDESAKCLERKNTTFTSLQDLRLYREDDDGNDKFFVIKTFVHFLAIHSWGNCKRLITIFDSFVSNKENSEEYFLDLKTKDLQRLILASHLYILFHHHLARVFINADDKLVVSSFAVFHYIMKFHAMGFSRWHINRMYQTLNVHNSPELAKVVEIIINKVLNNHIRRIRNSFHRYRFSSLYEQEIHYITTISEKESAAFSFSLDAMESIKRTYKNMLKAEQSKQHLTSKRTIADLHVILGYFNLWEQSFDEASTQFQSAISIYEQKQIHGNLDVLIVLVEAYIKRASLEERVGNYALSAALYSKAINKIEQYCILPDSIELKDSKFDIFKQPYWALRFLHLKRSAIHYSGNENNDSIDSLFSWIPHKEDSNCCLDDKPSGYGYYSQYHHLDVWHYRRAVIKLFIGQPETAYKCFLNVAEQLNVLNAFDERSCYLGGKSLLRASYCLLAGTTKHSLKKIKQSVIALQLESSFESKTKSRSKYENRVSELLKALDIFIPFLDDTLDSLLTKNIPKKNLEDLRKETLQHKSGHIVFKSFKQSGNTGFGNIFSYSLGLMSLSATAFDSARLNSNAAAAYLSIVLIWTALMEILPWRLLTNNRLNYQQHIADDKILADFNRIIDRLSSLRRKYNKIAGDSSIVWLSEAEKFAFERNSYSTSKAMSHSAKVLLRRSIIDSGEGLFSECPTVSEMVSDKKFYTYYLYQHYSMFGQMTISSIKWGDFSAQRLLTVTDKGMSEKAKLLPFSVRYYSTMLWLQGRHHLSNIIEGRISITAGSSDKDKSLLLPEELKREAIKALVKFYRASQYVVKTAGDSSNAILPPLFMIYYNMWEVVFHLTEIYCDNMTENNCHSFDMAISQVVSELDTVLIDSKIKDVSSRILNLSNLTVYTIDHFNIALKIDDSNSREATSTLRSKYYLDDDFEDDIFTLDWCYTQIFSPGAYIHRQTINMEMARLQEKYNLRVSGFDQM